MEHLQRVWLASRERLPFRTPGSVPHFGTCLCSNCWDQIPRTCHVFTRLFTSNTPWYFLDFASDTTTKNDRIYTRNQWKRNTCIFYIFQTWTCPSTFCFHQTIELYIFYQVISLCIDWLSIWLFKSTCHKTSYLTPCNVPHEWFEFLHCVLLAVREDYIFPTSKCRYSFSISKY